MPKFLYTVMFILMLPTAILVYSLLELRPYNYFYIFLFLVNIFLFLSGVFSLIGYFIARKIFRKDGEPRTIYRTSLRVSSYIAFGIFVVLFLLGFKLVSWVNVILSVGFYLTLGYQLFFYGKRQG
ncbi:MAG: hypothetical protein KatS3mg101_0588 [Patescibacteria group bacterium]|nr:MAG: hypothetical protein KatS3mg101_0588 [Patescibacteria group bacterium]